MASSSLRPFGRTPGGDPVHLITLDNDVLSCQIITFGAALRTLSVPGRGGTPVDVVLGYDTVEEYAALDGYLGAVVGRYANRIAGGRFSLHGEEYTLAVNDGANHLHGGAVGFSHRVWQVEGFRPDRAVLTLESPDGEEGYPGNLSVRVTYRLEGSALSICYEAVTDKDTVCNLTNHSYFNLSGHGFGPVLDQTIALFADHYTPTDEGSIPYGSILPVADTPMDLRIPTPIGARIREEFPQLIQARGYDHNYVLRSGKGPLRPAALAFSPATGISMGVHTTLPGLQFYTANFLNEGRPGKDGRTYGPRSGFCLETQFFPNSPNCPTFPSPLLRPGEKFHHETVFSFSVRA